MTVQEITTDLPQVRQLTPQVDVHSPSTQIIYLEAEVISILKSIRNTVVSSEVNRRIAQIRQKPIETEEKIALITRLKNGLQAIIDGKKDLTMFYWAPLAQPEAKTALGFRPDAFYQSGGARAHIQKLLEESYSELLYYDFSVPLEEKWQEKVEVALQNIENLQEYGKSMELIIYFLSQLESRGMQRERSVEILDNIDSLRPGWYLTPTAMNAIEKYARTIENQKQRTQFLETIFTSASNKQALVTAFESISDESTLATVSREVATALSGDSIENLAHTLGIKELVPFLYKLKADNFKNPSFTVAEFKRKLKDQLIPNSSNTEELMRSFFGQDAPHELFSPAKELSMLFLYSKISGNRQECNRYALNQSLEKTNKTEVVGQSQRQRQNIDAATHTFSLLVDFSAVTNKDPAFKNYLWARAMQEISIEVVGNLQDDPDKPEFFHVPTHIDANYTSLQAFHGWGANSSTWTELVKKIIKKAAQEEGKNVVGIIPNWMGSFASGKLTIASQEVGVLDVQDPSITKYSFGLLPLLRELFGSEILAGHSMGGNIVVQDSTHHPRNRGQGQFLDEKAYQNYQELLEYQNKPEKTVSFEPVTTQMEEEVSEIDLLRWWLPPAKIVGGMGAKKRYSCTLFGGLDLLTNPTAEVAGEITNIATGGGVIRRMIRKEWMQRVTQIIRGIGGWGGKFSPNKLAFNALVPNCPKDIAIAHGQELPRKWISHASNMLRAVNSLSAQDVEVIAELFKEDSLEIVIALGDAVLSPTHQLYTLLHRPDISLEVKDIIQKHLVVLGAIESSSGKIVAIDPDATHYAHAMDKYFKKIYELISGARSVHS